MRGDDESGQVVGYGWVCRRGIDGVDGYVGEDERGCRQHNGRHVPAILEEMRERWWLFPDESRVSRVRGHPMKG
jgi:hypothetical protein